MTLRQKIKELMEELECMLDGLPPEKEFIVLDALDRLNELKKILKD